MQQRPVNPDLIKERKKCTFDNLELTHLLDGGAQKTEDRKIREKFFLDDPELRSDTPTEYLSHKEKYEEAIKKSCILFRKVQELQNAGHGGMDNFRDILGGQLGSAILKDGNPFALHYVMFIPTVMGQGTIEQQAEWIQKAWTCDIIGTYAQDAIAELVSRIYKSMDAERVSLCISVNLAEASDGKLLIKLDGDTELGHGTFIRGLETVATYDPKTQEFVLNSPTLTSFKWWPGGLGHSANYAIVLAQLYTQGKCHGIHPFVVQLRDVETHHPMPGIKIGEIGCKLGMNSTNNGYLGFNNVRVPRENMLMKNNKVLPDGTYVESPSSKLTYGTMIFVRVILVQDCASYLKKAVCIATRYSAVRHQSKIKPDEPEPQILDFVTQQYKLFTGISTCFAFQFSASWIWDVYNNVTSELETGQLDSLPELHAIACCLKAICTADAASAVETCRLSCGGHGYMTSSNLPSIYGLVTAMCTYEGENTVLLLQTARYLVKMWNNKDEAQKLMTVQYMANKQRIKPFEKSVDWIISALQQTSASKIDLASHHIDDRVRRGRSQEDAWNETSVELVQCADAHGRAVLVQIYADTVKRLNVSVSLKKVLVHLLELYAVNTALRSIGDLLRFSNITGRDFEILQSWLEELLAAIRPNAVGIVDSFDLRDEILGSTLGAYDGNVYERLFEEASKSPLNAEPVNKTFKMYLKPFLKSSL